MNPKDQKVVETTEIHTNKPRKNQLGYIAIIFVCIVYLVNPGSGFIEAVPDIIPLVGNLDEAAITTVIIWIIKKMRES